MTDISLSSLTRAELQLLYSTFSLSEPTRASLAGETRTSIVKATDLINAMEGRGFIRKAGKTRSTGGRPAFIYRLRPEVGFAAGMSVWHDRLQAVLINATCEILFEQSYPLDLPPDPAEHAGAVIEGICGVFERMQRSHDGLGPVLSLGLSLPGMVDSRRGVWLEGLQLAGISHLRIAELVKQRIGIPTYCEDVARTLAFLALRREPTHLAQHFVLLYVGSGMGTGVVINRRIYEGTHGLAGEIGHIAHANNDYRCSCNNVGCFETILSVPGILRLFRDRLRQGVQSMLQGAEAPGNPPPLTLETILDAARRGDRFTLMTLAEVGTFLGDACAMLVKLFNPSFVVVTGPLAIFEDYFAEPLKRVLTQKVLPEMLDGYRTAFSEYRAGDEAFAAALGGLDRSFNERLAAVDDGRTA